MTYDFAWGLGPTRGLFLAAFAGWERKHPSLSGPQTGKRKRETRKADGKLTLLVTPFSLPILAYPFQGHRVPNLTELAGRVEYGNLVKGVSARGDTVARERKALRLGRACAA